MTIKKNWYHDLEIKVKKSKKNGNHPLFIGIDIDTMLELRTHDDYLWHPQTTKTLQPYLLGLPIVILTCLPEKIRVYNSAEAKVFMKKREVKK